MILIILRVVLDHLVASVGIRIRIVRIVVLWIAGNVLLVILVSFDEIVNLVPVIYASRESNFKSCITLLNRQISSAVG